MKYLVFDLQAILYRTFFGNKDEDLDVITDRAAYAALGSMMRFYRMVNPDRVVIAFDRRSWRVAYTESKESHTKKKYKGTRRQKMTPKEREKFEAFMEHVKEFEEIMVKHTSTPCLVRDGYEADDLIAGFVEAYGEDGKDEIVIVSRDRDLAQLQGNGRSTFYPNVTQLDPATGEYITIESAIRDLLKIKPEMEVEHPTADYLLFCKCIRGDTSDNVQSAFPGVRRTRIDKAYNDEFERTSLLNETWQDPEGDTFRVKDMFHEGKILMNLRFHTEKHHVEILRTILTIMDNPGEFSHFHFLKYLGKNNMKSIADDLETFAPMLSS